MKPVDGQRFEIVQLLDVAIADVAAGLVPLPDDRGVMASPRIAWRCGRTGASQLQPSVPVTRTPRSSRYSVASAPMPQPEAT